MRYDYLQGSTKEGRMIDAIGGLESLAKWNGDLLDYRHAFTGEVEGTHAEALESLYELHNIGDRETGERPRGREIRSMSVGDVIVLWDAIGFAPVAVFFCASVGWLEVRGGNRARWTLEIMARGYTRTGTVPTARLVESLLPAAEEVAR